MQGLSFLLLLIGLLFIVYNSILNLTNLTKIINYCFESNSLDKYWNLVEEACLHRRAIYSTIIISAIAAFVYLVLLPIILIRGIFFKKKMEARYHSGAYFRYADRYLTNKKFDFSNLHELGIDTFEHDTTGNVKIDFAMVMGQIEEFCDNKNLNITKNFFEVYDLSNKMRVLIPVTIEIGERTFPLYLIYTQEHRDAYQRINPVLKDNHFENALYLSLIPI